MFKSRQSASAPNHADRHQTRRPLAASIRRALARIALFTALWLVIAGSDPGSWIIGAPTILLASLASLRLARDQSAHYAQRSGLRLGALLWLVPYFSLESVRGGIDVASRVLRRRIKINPGFHHFRPRLQHPIARVLLLDCISLLPGTLSADMRHGTIEVHALDASSDPTPELQRLERLLGRLFGESLEETSV